MTRPSRFTALISGLALLVLSSIAFAPPPVRPIRPIRPIEPIKPFRPIEPIKPIEPGIAGRFGAIGEPGVSGRFGVSGGIIGETGVNGRFGVAGGIGGLPEFNSPAMARARLKSDIESKIATDPVGALRLIKGSKDLDPIFIGLPRLSTALELSDRVELTRKAVDAVVVRAERVLDSEAGGDLIKVGVDSWSRLAATSKALGEVLEAGREIDTPRLGELRTRLFARKAELGKLCLDRAVDEASTRARRGDWEEASSSAGENLKRLDGVAGTDALRAFVVVGERARAIDKLPDTSRGSPAEIAAKLEHAETKNLPPPLAREAKALVELGRLREALNLDWSKQTPDFNRLLSDLDAFLATGGDPVSFRETANQLAARAFLSDRPAEANLFLDKATASRKGEPPTPKEKLSMEALHRDLGKVLQGNEGSVQAWAAEGFVPPVGGVKEHPIRGPPPGVAALRAPGDREGYRPPVKEDVRAALASPPEMVSKQLDSQAERWRDESGKVRETLKTEQTLVLKHASDRSFPLPEGLIGKTTWNPGSTDAKFPLVRRKPVPQPTDDEDDEKLDDDRFIAKVERELGRPLTDVEKRVIRDLRPNFKSAKRVAESLKSAP